MRTPLGIDPRRLVYIKKSDKPSKIEAYLLSRYLFYEDHPIIHI